MSRRASSHIGVVGGGIVGIAIARALSARGNDVTVFEKEDRLAAHQTGRNSGVVHAGIYYAPGSLKARFCALGRELTRDFCREHALPYRELGKLVVAVTADELDALASIERRATENMVPGLRRVDAAQLRTIEPHAVGVAALHSPRTAAVDYRLITETMAGEVRAGGGRILLGHGVTSIRQNLGRVHVLTPRGEEVVDQLVVCAGLQSDLVALMAGAPASPRILPFRGEYWAIDPDRVSLVNGMIYPVPDPRFPFLGVHFTRGVHDEVHIGPNAVPALAREGYRWRDLSVRDTWGSLTWRGAPALARRHWRMGIKEITSSLLKRRFFREAQRYVPELLMSDLVHRAPAGVRAQAWARDGSLLDDFAVDQIGAITLLRNAPSPAATSAMAIADHILETYL